MPRRRRPFITNGEEVSIDAPGLNIVRGKDLYWCASYSVQGREALARGYKPATVRIHPTDALNTTSIAGLSALALRCHVLQKEMLAWLKDPDGTNDLVFDGTLNSLIRCYQQDPESSYADVQVNTRGDYDDSLAVLANARGTRRLDRLNGQEFKKLFREMMLPIGGAPRIRRARGGIKLLRILLVYGTEAGIEICSRMLEVVDRMQFRVPDDMKRAWRLAKPKKMAMSLEHAQAIVREGLKRGTRRHRSVALAVAAQFEFTMRRIDVIGSWSRAAGRALPKGAIVARGLIWTPGLTFEALASGVLDLSTSKNDTDASFEVGEYPLFLGALSTVPETDRAGPLVVNDNGLPMKQRYYAEIYDELALAAGVPAEVWSSRARHGGLTEGYEAIIEAPGSSTAELADLKYHGQHATLTTTLNAYVKPGSAPSKRVARRRVAKRKRDQGAA